MRDIDVGDLPWATIVVLVLVVTGCIDVLDGSLSKDYERFVTTVAIPVAGLALGRGWAARKPG